jgi:DNA-binding LacI/PurR family transcriptional regulator
MLGDFGHDWYASGVIAGIDQAAEETGVTLELLGNRDGDVKSVSRRLLQSRPDVLAFCAPPLRHTVLISEARRLDIPCIGTGTLLSSIGVPTACEDGADAAKQAVKHLVGRGHRRIGMVLGCFAIPWIFQRRQGYIDGLVESGIEPDECLMLWLTGYDDTVRAEQIKRYLDKYQPTALLFASWVLTPPMAPLVRSGTVSIPRDLSVVVFDQQATVENWIGCRPTTLALPLMEMGKRLAHMANDLVQNKPVDVEITLPCNLIEGDSVAEPRPG